MAVSANDISIYELAEAYSSSERKEDRGAKKVQGRRNSYSLFEAANGNGYVDEIFIFYIESVGNLPCESVNPLLKNSIQGVVEVMVEESEYEEKKRAMLNTLKQSSRLRYQTDEEKIAFIRGCEQYYNRTTEQHLSWYEQQGYEGNVDDNRWYRFAKYLRSKGKL